MKDEKRKSKDKCRCSSIDVMPSLPKLPAASIISCGGSCGRFDGYLRCTQNPHNTAAGSPKYGEPGGCMLLIYFFSFYLLISQKRMRIAATSARVALSCGFSLPLEPLTMPLATAHCIAFTA